MRILVIYNIIQVKVVHNDTDDFIQKGVKDSNQHFIITLFDSI